MCHNDSGRYHIIYIMTLCFTECVPGRYGVDCQETCSLFCGNKSCNRTTGTCLHGCNSGYTGRFCNQSAYSNLY